VIDGATNRVTTTVPVGNFGGTRKLGLDSVTHTLYVLSSSRGVGDTVTAIDETTNAVIAKLSLPDLSASNSPGAFGIGVDPTTHSVYVSRYGPYIVPQNEPVGPGTVAVLSGVQ
jgi:DNA-binding beta-propeller fold protein YncE